MAVKKLKEFDYEYFRDFYEDISRIAFNFDKYSLDTAAMLEIAIRELETKDVEYDGIGYVVYTYDIEHYEDYEEKDFYTWYLFKEKQDIPNELRSEVIEVLIYKHNKHKQTESEKEKWQVKKR